MSKKPSEENNPGHVTRAECHRTTTAMKDDLKTIRTALVGEDMRGGIVKDVADLKKEKSVFAQAIKSVAVPILVTVIAAWIITGAPH